MANKHPISTISISIALALLPMTPISAQESPPPQQVLERLFEVPEIDPAWFAPGFLSQVPAGQVAAIIAQFEQQYGSIQSIAGEDRRFIVTLERADVPTQLAIDEQGRITFLFFETPVASGGLARQIEAIAALPGETSVFGSQRRQGRSRAQGRRSARGGLRRQTCRPQGGCRCRGGGTAELGSDRNAEG